MILKQAATLILATALVGNGIRVNDLEKELQFAALQQSEAPARNQLCIEALLPVVQKITYRFLFRPILDGEYTLYNRHTETYLAVDASGNSVVSSDHRGAKSRWQLEQVQLDTLPTDMPTYTLKNVHTGGYLAAFHSAADHSSNTETTYTKEVKQAKWFMDLRSDGVHYVVRNLNCSQNLMAQSDGSANVNIGSDGLAEEWELRRRERWYSVALKEGSYKKQWRTVASKLPVADGLNWRLTWHQMCPDKHCEDSYVSERVRQKDLLKKITESKGYVVTENKVRGVCDWGIPSLRAFVHDMNMLRELYVKEAWEGCPTRELREFANSLADAISVECFDACLADFRTELEAVSCKTNATDWAAVFTEVVSSETKPCAGLPSDSLEHLANFVMEEKCWTHHAPTLLWVPNDKVPNDIESYDHAAVCSVPLVDQHHFRDRKGSNIVQRGTCPEGTTCDCPIDWHQSHRTTAEMRGFLGLSWVDEGSARMPSLMTQYHSRSLAGTTMSALSRGITAALAPAVVLFPASLAIAGLPLMAGAFAATGLAGVAGFSNGLMLKRDAWRCADTVGCWPQSPKVQSTVWSTKACRLESTAQGGGSPVWYMPPPMMYFQKEFFGCGLVRCSDEHILAQKVGFAASPTYDFGSKPNVYNCQPMIFEDMDTAQKHSFLKAMKDTGVEREYPDLLDFIDQYIA